jgi:hypothetical protein
MSQKAKSMAIAADDTMLQSGVNNNFGPWQQITEMDARRTFGILADIINGAIPTLPAVMPADYMPVEGLDFDGNEPVPFTAPAIARMREAAVISRNKENAKLVSKRPMLYAYLMEHLSSDSTVVVASHSDYEDAHRNSDPKLLWDIIVYTHLTHVNGAGPELAELVRDDQQERFASMKQTNRESIGDFLKRLKHSYTLLLVAGVPEYTEPQKAIHFLKRLDPHRHGMMYAEMINRAHRNEPLPQTLFAAYTIASNYLVKKSQSGFDHDEHRIYNLQGRGGRGRDSGRGRGGGRGRGRGKDGPAADVSEKVETRSCYNCGETGHIRPKCPHPREDSNNIIAVTTADDIDQIEDDDGYAFVTRSVDVAPIILSTNLLSTAGPSRPPNTINNIVILDSGANIHCFGSSNLLENILPSNNSIKISGFQDGGGIILRNIGNFSTFGRVWFDDRLNVNILSFAALVAGGAIIRYDSGKDCFYVKPPSCSSYFIFRRDAKSGLYTINFHTSDPWGNYGDPNPSHKTGKHLQYFHSKILVTTVEENKSKFTAREATAAENARLFMGKMGISNSIAAKRVINNMLNCSVTERAIDIADAIYGRRAYQSLSGGTKKLKTLAAVEAIIPRLQQQQQVASIDLMFIKPFAFLVMLLKPLDMILCQVLNSFTDEPTAGAKSAKILSKCLHGMISTCRSRGFVVQAIKCDGEKGIAAIIPQLNNLGLEVFTVGAGSHVPEIESRIRLVKEKAREFFTCLPFTMPNVMIVYCVYFSVGTINNYISIHSLDNCSPRQRFTGRKLDAKLDIRFAFGDYCHATVAETNNSMTSRTDPCICLLSSMNLNGSVKMLDLNTFKVITRDQFVLLPMPQSVIQRLTRTALAEGRKHTVRFSGGQDVVIDIEGVAAMPDFIVPADEDVIGLQELAPVPGAAIEGEDPIITDTAVVIADSELDIQNPAAMVEDASQQFLLSPKSHLRSHQSLKSHLKSPQSFKCPFESPSEDLHSKGLYSISR